MKIPAQRADTFARAPDPRIRTVLVHGPNIGLTNDRVDALMRSVVDDVGDAFRVARMSSGELLADRARLRDEADALSLTGGCRVVLVRDAGDATAALFAEYIAEPERETMVIVQAGALSTRSSLRKVFESRRASGSIACYEDDEVDRARFLRQCFKERGAGAEGDVVDYLATQLGPDRAMARNTVETLVLHAGPGLAITLDAVRALVEDSATASVEDVAVAAGAGDVAALSRALDRATQAGAAPVTLLRASQRHFQRLHWLVGAYESGETIDDAIGALRPPVFWRVRPQLAAQARSWSLSSLARALAVLTEAELCAKSTGVPDTAVCCQTLMDIAGSIGRKAAA